MVVDPRRSETRYPRASMNRTGMRPGTRNSDRPHSVDSLCSVSPPKRRTSCPNGDLRLESRQVSTQAGVRAAAEREVGRRVLACGVASDVESLGVLEVIRVAVAGGEQRDDLGVDGDDVVAELRVFVEDPHGGEDGAGVAQALLDGAHDEVGEVCGKRHAGLGDTRLQLLVSQPAERREDRGWRPRSTG